jgi:hypothetical protein
MNLNELSAYFGILSGLAGGGSLYFVWTNDKLARFTPHDKNIDEAFSGNENAAGLVTSVRSMLQRLRSSRELRIALSVARQMHFARPMDDALIEINRRAIELNDLGFTTGGPMRAAVLICYQRSSFDRSVKCLVTRTLSYP